MKLLAVYATQNNSTRETADYIAEKLRNNSHTVTVANAKDVYSIAEYDALILGSGIYKGMSLPEMFTFMNRVGDDLLNKPVFCFILCIRVLEDGGYEHALQNYMPVSLLNELDLRDCKVFPGKLDVDAIDWDERWTLVLHYDGHMYPNNIKADFRQWEAVEAWAEQIHMQLSGG